MFTGIIQATGRVESNLNGRLRLSAAGLGKLPMGASISVNGACLTLTKQFPAGGGRKGRSPNRAAVLEFDLSPETLRLTNLGELRPNDTVNLEASLRARDLIGGHWVSGHVDACDKILKTARLSDGCLRMRIALPRILKPLVALKGSIAVDGISLTVTQVGRNYFETILIPHTLNATTLGRKKPENRVNLEADLVARYIRNILKNAVVIE